MVCIKLNPMLKIQKELNDKIKQTQNITYENIKYKSRLALMAELMELCNETRCFNYWSKKTCSNDDIVLEEFADVVCFTLTECLEYEVFTKSDELFLDDDEAKKLDNDSLTLLFLEMIKEFSKIKNKRTCKNFVKKLFHLGYKLGYTYNQIFDAYTKKCIKNHSVQDNFNK